MTDDELGTTPPPRSKRGLREGFTTGACATAASLAATRALLRQHPVTTVTIHLPIGRDATFALARCEVAPGYARSGVVKDAGDDPDVTHGAEIISSVSWLDRPGLELAGGPGVGTVTRPGLGLEVGGPAINPVPRRMIAEHVRAEAEPVLATGGRSEQYSMRLFPDLPEMAFVEMGEFTGAALKRCVQAGVERATIAGMVGKFSKLAMGHFMTHVAGNQVDVGFLADVAAECGASDEVQAQMRAANTARHV